MDWTRWEVLSVMLLFFSVGAYALAWSCSNTKDLVYAKRAMLVFTATSLALAFPLGALYWQDLFGIAGVTCLWAVTMSRQKDAVVLAILSAVLLAIWAWHYDMSGAEYAACFSLAALNPLLALWLKHLRQAGPEDGYAVIYTPNA